MSNNDLHFEPGLVPINLGRVENLGILYDCDQGFVAFSDEEPRPRAVGLGYACRFIEDGDTYYVITHMLSGLRLPGSFATADEAQRVVTALAQTDIDWWQPQKELRVHRERYVSMVGEIAPEALATEPNQ